MSLPLILFVLFVGLPILEIAAFIKIGEWIGVIPTLLGCVVTAVIGAYLVRLQGFGVLQKAQEAIARNELPVDQIAHGVLILVAGVLLMTPGYVTDTMGFLLLIPAIRVRVARAVIAYVKSNADIHVAGAGWGAARQEPSGVVIEGEAVEIIDKE
ncbi:MAG: FxsA family protein [Pseudomonadota bacterium]